MGTVKTRTVLHKQGQIFGGVLFSADLAEVAAGDARPTSVGVPEDVWADLGSPDTITVTIEPGDKLNEG